MIVKQRKRPGKKRWGCSPLQANRHIDLHVHSTASDGSLTPNNLVKQAVKLNLAAISITDHDTVAGISAAKDAATGHPLEFLAGVEISAAPPRTFQISGSIHILGYGFDPHHGPFNQMLNRLQRARRERGRRMISRLKKAGVVFSTKDAAPEDPNTPISRPHIARALVLAGIVPTIDAAFDQYLGIGKIGYVDKYRVPYREAVDRIRAGGGVSILAHPGLIRMSDLKPVDRLIRKLVDEGLDGLEALYPLHNSRQTRELFVLAKKMSLLVTGGTDFHGSVSPDIHMGEGQGDFHVPYKIYEKLVKALPQNTQHSKHLQINPHGGSKKPATTKDES